MPEYISKKQWERAKNSHKIKFNGSSYEWLGSGKMISYDEIVGLVTDFKSKVMIFDERGKLFAVLVPITADEYKTVVRTQDK